MLVGWDAAAERRAKELLYRFLEELQVTRAALYLVGNDGSFGLVGNYGFGRHEPVVPTVREAHPLWNWVRRNRTVPVFENEVRNNRSLAPVFEGSGCDRLLTVPLSIDDRLIGFVDARDKARKIPFRDDDVAKARAIAVSIESFLVERQFFGPATRENAAPVPAELPVSTPRSPRADGLDIRLIEHVTRAIKTAARFPGIAAAAITVSDGKTARVTVLSAAEPDPNQQEALARHQAEELEALGVHLGPPRTWGWTLEEGPAPERRWEVIRTVVLETGPPQWLMTSVITPSDSTAGEAFVTLAYEQANLARQLHTYRKAARNLARVLLEPGETQYPHLQQHSQAVSELAQRFAAILQLGYEEEELVTIAGYLHDIGMRELDYARIYRKDRPDDSDRRHYRRHPLIGARILEGTSFPGDLARVVRHHHERWDGAGYPDKVSGNSIPLGSRIIHLCEAFDTLTSAGSYRRPVSRERALTIIQGEAGTQFDPNLVPILVEVVAG